MTDSKAKNNHQTLYRRYRPESFADVHGQEHVTDVLMASMKKSDVGHAYLFIGTRGIGKTTIARVFAKDLGCNPEDIYEIDGASHRKIDDIRAIRDAVGTLPFSSPYKIYIIDEVHMLTKEAFNALLKTLEEPPAHVIFMMATTEPEKIPDTIISRCQVYRLRRPSIATIAENIDRVVQKEKKKIEKEASELIALFAHGSFRDSLSILQKVMSFSDDKKISVNEVEHVLGASSRKTMFDYLSACAVLDTERIMEILYTIEKDDHDAYMFVVRMVQQMRDLLHARFVPARRKELLEISDEVERDWIEKYIGTEGKVLNAHFLSTLLDLQGRLRNAANPHTLLQIGMMEWAGSVQEK